MKKNCYCIFALLLCLCMAANAQPLGMSKISTHLAKEDNIAKGFGYADRYATELFGIGNGKVTILTAFCKVDNVQGATLKHVDAVLAACYTDEDGAVLVLDKDMKVVYMEKKTVKVRYNHLELSTPYVFTTNEPYYIGYLIHSTQKAAYPLGFDKQEGISEGCYMGIHSAMPEEGKALGEDIFNTVERKHKFGTLMIFAGIENAPALDNMAYLLELDGVLNATANQEVEAKARIRNIGMKDITAEELSAMVGADLQEIKRDILIEQGATFGLPVTIKMPAEGKGTVTLKLLKINGQDNAFAGVEASKEYAILAEEGPFPRETVLIEHFTTEECVNCPSAEPIFKAYIQAFSDAGLKVNVIEHHAGYKNDAFTIQESEDLLDYLGVGFAPAAAIDRLGLGENKECAFFPHIDYTEGFRKMLKDNLEYGRIETIEQTVANGKVSVKVTGSLVDGFKDDLYLSALVTEDNLPAIKQAGASGEFIHHDVARMFLSSATGDKATVNGKKFEISFPAKAYNANWKPENMKIVVFGHKLLDKTTMTDYKQHAVLFSSNAKWNVVSGIGDVNNGQAPVVTVSDSRICVNGDFSTMEVYGMDGSLLATSTDRSFAPGVYVVKLNGRYGKWTTKVVVP